MLVNDSSIVPHRSLSTPVKSPKEGQSSRTAARTHSKQINTSTNKTSQRPLLPSLIVSKFGMTDYRTSKAVRKPIMLAKFLPSTFPITADGKRKRTFSPHRTHLSASCYYGWT